MTRNRDKHKGGKRRRLLRISVLPVLITLINALCGFAAIHFAARGMNEPHRLWLEKPELTFFAAAAWMIFVAMLADAVDGFVARRSGSSSEFGEQLDSLSDVISFGVAPAFLMLRVVESGLQESASPLFGSFLGRLLWLVAALYVCCAVLRLARFTVETSTEESAHMGFSGLPSPAAAAVIAALVLLYGDIVPELQKGPAPEVARVGSAVVIYMLPVVTVAVALLMVSRLRYVHLLNQYIRGPKPFGYVVLLVLVLLLLLFWAPQFTLTAAALGFAGSGPVRWLWRRGKGRRQGTGQTEAADQAEAPGQIGDGGA